jgi:L-amino acid N-acyltransferase YncA
LTSPRQLDDILEFLVRPVSEQDAAAIVELLNPIIRAGTYTVMDAPFTVDDQSDFIRGFPARGIYLAAVRDADHAVVGIQDVMPRSESNVFRHVGEISTFVAMGCHRQGIGARLCQATFAAAQTQGFRKLCATVRADNPHALAFYQGHGFHVVGTAHQHAFLRGQYIDEILLELNLAKGI